MPLRRNRRHLIDILQDVQSREGYLSNAAMLRVAKFLDMPSATVWGVATFYNQFRFTPPGRQSVRVCMGTACHLAGGQLVLDAMSRELKIEVGGTTEDREFDLDRVACIGCCALAPVVTIGGGVYSRMTPPKVEEALVALGPTATN
jgi:NADH-quinone oxidoreductase subunit E